MNVLVTGASSGLGAEMAIAYARRGARVALFARRLEALDSVAARCQLAGAAEAIVLVGDVTERDDVSRVLAELDQRWPRLDRVVLNAGVALTDGTARTFAECCSSDTQTAAAFDATTAAMIMHTNYL